MFNLTNTEASIYYTVIAPTKEVLVQWTTDIQNLIKLNSQAPEGLPEMM